MLKKLIELLKSLFGNKNNNEVTQPISGETNTGNTETQETPITVPTEPEVIEESATTEVVGVDKPETVNPEPAEPKSVMKILIDNGHGYDTPGKRSPWCAKKAKPEIEFYEYKWNREIAREVVKQLNEKGYDAELIVTEENDISLTERANRVNAVCDSIGASKVIFVSIHANAAGNGAEWMNAKGWCAFTTCGKTNSDRFAEFLYDAAEKNFVGRKIRTDKSDGDRDWEANFTVIYKSRCVSVLTENFFYDNVDDVQYILSDEGRAAVIKTHVDGIINYIKYLGK